MGSLNTMYTHLFLCRQECCMTVCEQLCVYMCVQTHIDWCLYRDAYINRSNMWNFHRLAQKYVVVRTIGGAPTTWTLQRTAVGNSWILKFGRNLRWFPKYFDQLIKWKVVIEWETQVNCHWITFCWVFKSPEDTGNAGSLRPSHQQWAGNRLFISPTLRLSLGQIRTSSQLWVSRVPDDGLFQLSKHGKGDMVCSLWWYPRKSWISPFQGDQTGNRFYIVSQRSSRSL